MPPEKSPNRDAPLETPSGLSAGVTSPLAGGTGGGAFQGVQQLPVPTVGVSVSWEGRTYVLEAFEGDHITNQLRKGTFYEADLLRAIKAQYRQGVYIDVGAHIGNHSVFFASECRAKRVVAIEPRRESWILLTHNLCNIPRTLALHGAIHPTWKWARSVLDIEGNTGMARIVEGEPGDTSAFRVDDIVGEEGCAVLKIDAEGREASILLSALETISKWHPLISTEAATEDEYKMIAAILKPRGYQSTGPYAKTPTYLWTP